MTEFISVVVIVLIFEIVQDLLIIQAEEVKLRFVHCPPSFLWLDLNLLLNKI